MKMGNCKFFEWQKILFINEMKENKIWPRPKGYVGKIFWTLLPNFARGSIVSWHIFFHFALMKMSEMKAKVHI
jgi:hypothetical protein